MQDRCEKEKAHVRRRQCWKDSDGLRKNSENASLCVEEPVMMRERKSGDAREKSSNVKKHKTSEQQFWMQVEANLPIFALHRFLSCSYWCKTFEWVSNHSERWKKNDAKKREREIKREIKKLKKEKRGTPVRGNWSARRTIVPRNDRTAQPVKAEAWGGAV